MTRKADVLINYLEEILDFVGRGGPSSEWESITEICLKAKDALKEYRQMEQGRER